MLSLNFLILGENGLLDGSTDKQQFVSDINDGTEQTHTQSPESLVISCFFLFFCLKLNKVNPPLYVI